MTAKTTYQVPALILCNPKYSHNVAAAIRGCSCFGVHSLLWTGHRVTCNTDLGERLPREERMKGYKNVAWQVTQRPFDLLPPDITPVCIELCNGSESLADFEHPDNPVYIFGPEDGSVPQVIRRFCHRFVHIPSHHCLNLAAAINVVLYDRRQKRISTGMEPRLPIELLLHEQPRGEIAIPGWEGK